MALRAESAQEEGRNGVLLTKRWLESTTHIEMPFDVYDFISETTVTCLNGAIKSFDLKGKIHKSKSVLYVENKSYTQVGDQPSEFMEFLAVAYSATAFETARVQDPGWQFMWVTTFPFSQKKWAKLTKRSEIKAALEADSVASAAEGEPGLLNGQVIDDEILDKMPARLWLLVLNKRQKELTLTESELSKVEAILKRKGKSKS